MIKVKIKLFSYLRDNSETDEFTCNLEKGSTLDKCVDILKEKLSIDISEKIIRIAVNQSYENGNPVLNDGDEIALIPPVSGG